VISPNLQLLSLAETGTTFLTDGALTASLILGTILL